ncbi:hypothetical protein RYZ26_06495 [Terasakiella sp. A23]|uniref:hypothetical protein n=1 Tax=Terasakiella sp. FCG-A23 TaxID=3080561 RepID=UPI0029546B27|nr:hypothetical protein [Terasakiella sp. A23]MDV7339234.1 hypothetical protein [Terasakiella sp. A23]
MWTVLTAICLAALVCGPVWAIARFLRVPLPKFVLPMLAGITLFSYNIYMSYSWIDRMIDSYDTEIVVLKEYRSKSFFMPWTIIVPRVSHFIAANTKQEPEQIAGTNILHAPLVAMQEHVDPLNLSAFIKCEEKLVSVQPLEQVAKAENPLDVAQWTPGSEFPYVMDYFCKG